MIVVIIKRQQVQGRGARSQVPSLRQDGEGEVLMTETQLALLLAAVNRQTQVVEQLLLEVQWLRSEINERGQYPRDVRVTEGMRGSLR